MALSVCLSFCLGRLARRGRRSRCFGIPFKALLALNRLPGEAMGFCRGGHALAAPDNPALFFRGLRSAP